MARIAKVTDLTKLEGDPDPSRADIEHPRLHLELHAGAPWRAGFITFVARCSERSPVARALTVSLLMFTGLALALVVHVVLVGLPRWLTAAALMISMFAPAGVYWALLREERAASARRRRSCR
jgi:hypothetical protein